MQTRWGRAVLARRRAKGRHRLTVSDTIAGKPTKPRYTLSAARFARGMPLLGISGSLVGFIERVASSCGQSFFP